MHCAVIETVPSLGQIYHVDTPTKRRLVEADKVLSENVVQATMSVWGVTGQKVNFRVVDCRVAYLLLPSALARGY